MTGLRTVFRDAGRRTGRGATNAAGQRSRPQSLSFTIVKR
jgi:hypothetical protein